MLKSEEIQTVQTETETDTVAARAAERKEERLNGDGTERAQSSLGAAGSVRPCPFPAGVQIYGELSSVFVDGAKLLSHLAERRHTGALVDSGKDTTQAVILHEGEVVALVGSGGGGFRRLDRIHLAGPDQQEEHRLNVFTYRPEVALALAQLINLPERFARLHGSFVDLPALLAHLRREKANGGVRVTTSEDTAIVLLRSGEVLGAYTRRHPELDDPDTVFPLAKAADAEIDVHIGTLTIPPPSAAIASILA